ncbi:MAG: translation initiation factor IF-3 [Planctomycetia bacterium]
MAVDRSPLANNRAAPPTGPRVNDQIRISPLRVVDANGDMLGVISREQALDRAREQELDLVEVAPTERPPVCKIMDFGKFKYEQTKKARKSKQHSTQMKEIRVRPRCGDADLEVKMNHAREFLGERDKVLVTVQFKGRELAHVDLGVKLINDLVEKLSDVAKMERAPTREGKRISAVLAPK